VDIRNFGGIFLSFGEICLFFDMSPKFFHKSLEIGDLEGVREDTRGFI